MDFGGPDFAHVDNRFAALTLVQKGLCDAALFSPQGAAGSPHGATCAPCVAHMAVAVHQGAPGVAVADGAEWADCA